MGLSCRICKQVFSVPLTSEDEPLEDFNIKAVKCGHLFHQKCLEASLTHQKLSHAMHGTGPFRKLCPAFQCGTLITLDSDIIKLCVAREELQLDVEVNEDTQLSSDVRLTKQVQRLALERDQWKTKAEGLLGENEILNDALDEIKYECEELRSFLNEEESIQKGDRAFWVNPDGSFSPAKIIEIRQKSTQSMPFVVIKLERKKKTIGNILQGERETFIVAANEILTFKSFFKEYFDNFSYKLRNIMSEMVTPQSNFMSGKSFRKISKKRSSAGDIMRSTSCGSITTPSVYSISVEAIDKLNFGPSSSSSSSAAAASRSKGENQQRTIGGIYRRKTIHSGSVPGKTSCSARASARNRSVSHSYPQNLSWSDNKCQSFDSASMCSSVFNSPLHEKLSDNVENEYINIGERVIRYDSYCDHPQVGNVVAIFQYTKCAIVKFDKVPQGPQQLEYRTVPIQELFPYDLASVEEKYEIANIYEQTLELEYEGYDIMEEVEEHPMPMSPHNDDDDQQEFYQRDYNANRSDIISQYDVIPSTIRPPSFSSETSGESLEEVKTAYDVVTALLFSMFYSTSIFERTLLDNDSSDNEKQTSIKQLLNSDVTATAKSTGNLPEEFVQNLITILEFELDECIQPQVLLTTLFGDAMQSKPFINLTNGEDQQFVFNLAIPEYFGENDGITSANLQDLLEKTLQSSGDHFSSMPSPALILSVNRPHFSRGSYIIPPVKLSLAQAVNMNNDEDLCSCNKVATWKCRTCAETMKNAVPGYCDDCRHTTAEFHKELDHFPLLSYSKDGSNKKLRLLAVVCKSKNHTYSSFIKCGMVHSDSWVFCQPTNSTGEKSSKVTPVGSIQSWLDNLDGESSTELSTSQKIPHLVKKLLVEGCLFIYSPLN